MPEWCSNWQIFLAAKDRLLKLGIDTMNARKWINNCFAGYFSVSLIGLAVPVSKAESGFTSKIQYKSKYSRDISSLNYNTLSDYNTFSFEPGLQLPLRSTNLGLSGDDSSKFQKRAGTTVYKAMKMSKSKLATKLAGAALLYGLDSLDMAEPLKNGFNYVKEKTRFNFGKCSQIRLSTKRLKARSCFFDTDAKLEFHANYKMDAFRLKFNWPL